MNWYASGKIWNWFCCKRKSQRKASDKSRHPQCELDSDLLDYPPMGLFEDYLEMGMNRCLHSQDFIFH